MKKNQPKEKFAVFDYVTFPTDKGSKEIREGFVFQIRSSQIDVVSWRSEEGNSMKDFGFHKKFLEKDRWDEVEPKDIGRDISSWPLYRAVAWAMVRFYISYGNFMTDYIKPIIALKETDKKTKIEQLVNVVRKETIAFDRKNSMVQKFSSQKKKKLSIASKIMFDTSNSAVEF